MCKVGQYHNGWRDPRDYAICQQKEDAWLDASDSPLLKVPSAIITTSFNFVINTMHPGYNMTSVVGVTDLIPDARIDEILKHYKE